MSSCLLSPSAFLEQFFLRTLSTMCVHTGRASEWLGIITAGSLWTPMHDESMKSQNLQAVVDQIKATVPTTALPASSGSANIASRAGPIDCSGDVTGHP